MVKQEIKDAQEFEYNKKLMQRYADSYVAKNGGKKLDSKAIEDILTAILSLIQVLVNKNPRNIARALMELGHLIKEYGAPLIWKLYSNFRKRQQRKIKQDENINLPPTEKKLQNLLAAHEAGGQDSKQNLQQRLVATTKQNKVKAASNRKSIQNAA